MSDHEFHGQLGGLIKTDFPDSKTLHVCLDKACDKEGSQIPLYSDANTGNEIKLCIVDILIEVDEKARVIIEIEESNVKPIHIMGKFFASSFCNGFGSKKSRRKPFCQSILFVQILKSSKNKQKSLKRKQWDHIDASIRSIITSPIHGREWEYRLYYGSADEYGEHGEKGHHLVADVRNFLGS